MCKGCHLRTFLDVYIATFLQMDPFTGTFQIFAFQNNYFSDFFWMLAFGTSYAAYLKKLIPISNEICLTKNSNVNFFLTHICLHSLEFFIS